MKVMHEHYEKNTRGRDFVIGDLHGCYALLLNGMSAVHFDERVDRMFSVGDLIDRGEQSLECLGLIESDWFYPVLGNHEAMMMEVVLEGASPHTMWHHNGGAWADDTDHDELKRLAEYAHEHVPFALTVSTDKGHVGICHAEPPSINWADAVNMTHPGDQYALQRMLWGRSWVQRYKQGREALVVGGVHSTFHGHTPARQVIVVGNVHFIDTGAVQTGNLTMFQIQGPE